MMSKVQRMMTVDGWPVYDKDELRDLLELKLLLLKAKEVTISSTDGALVPMALPLKGDLTALAIKMYDLL